MGTSIPPGELSEELRHDSGPFLKRRRSIVGLSFVSCGLLAGVACYQIGIVKKLPQPGHPAFDTEKVNGSPQAYSIVGVPDAFLGLASYCVTACLAAAGSENRWRRRPFVPIAMALKMIADAMFASKLTLDECRRFRAFSLWSVLTAASTVAALPLALPEVKAALTHLKREEHA